MATRNELLTALQNAPSTIDARFAGDPVPETKLNNAFRVDVIYWHRDGSVAKENRKKMLISGANADTGEASWHRSVPEPLQPAPPEPLADRATVLTYVNARIGQQFPGKTLIDPIIDVNDKRAIVSGLYPTGAGLREQRTYVFYQTNPALPALPGNISYDRVNIETAETGS